jgi:hypothetical protein
MEDLIALAQPLQDNVVLWRGVRSVVDTFGVPAEGLHDLIGAGARPRSFLQHLQIGALSKGNLRNRQPVHR